MIRFYALAWQGITSTGEWFVTNTMYNPNNGDPLCQQISISQQDGTVTSKRVMGGELLP